MKRLIEDTEANGLESLLNEKVLLMCANYFYSGTLTGVNETFVELSEPSIVYETGEWSKSTYSDAQKLHSKKWFVQRAAIESYGLSK